MRDCVTQRRRVFERVCGERERWRACRVVSAVCERDVCAVWMYALVVGENGTARSRLGHAQLSGSDSSQSTAALFSPRQPSRRPTRPARNTGFSEAVRAQAGAHTTTAMLHTAWARTLCAKSPGASVASFRGLHAQTRSVLGKLPRFVPQTSRVLSCLPRQPTNAWARTAFLGAPRFQSTLPEHRFFSSNASATAEAVDDGAAPEIQEELPVLSPPSVSIWLLASSMLVFIVVVVGGVTRLTESGLSITEWKPVTGMLPPLSQADWEEEFEKYKRTPEFKLYASIVRIQSMF